MAIVLIQPNSKTIWLRLWKFQLEGKKSTWIKKEFLIPYEEADTRFRTAARYLQDGWRFYLEKANPARGDKPVMIPGKLLEEIANDPPTFVEHPYSRINFAAHWHNVDRREDAIRNQPKGLQKTAIDAKEKLLQQYKQGKTLKPFQLAMIKDLI